MSEAAGAAGGAGSDEARGVSGTEGKPTVRWLPPLLGRKGEWLSLVRAVSELDSDERSGGMLAAQDWALAGRGGGACGHECCGESEGRLVSAPAGRRVGG